MITEEQIAAHAAEVTEALKDTADGPWKTEPHRVEFRHAGLDCLMVRTAMGAWCGYVGVPKAHADFGKEYGALEDIDVHGGLTYGRECQGVVCHAVDNDDTARWWFGFDCAHFCDTVPKIEGLMASMKPTFFEGHTWAPKYRDLAYVRAEVESLANQLARRKKLET